MWELFSITEKLEKRVCSVLTWWFVPIKKGLKIKGKYHFALNIKAGATFCCPLSKFSLCASLKQWITSQRFRCVITPGKHIPKGISLKRDANVSAVDSIQRSEILFRQLVSRFGQDFREIHPKAREPESDAHLNQFSCNLFQSTQLSRMWQRQMRSLNAKCFQCMVYAKYMQLLIHCLARPVCVWPWLPCSGAQIMLENVTVYAAANAAECHVSTTNVWVRKRSHSAGDHIILHCIKMQSF